MKRYDNPIFCCLIAVLFLTLWLPAASEARSVPPRMSCTKESKSFWLRNACNDGFVVAAAGNRLYAQADDLDQHDSRVEIMKEACQDHSTGLFGPIKTRLYFPSVKKFICLTSKGQVRTVSRQHVKKYGNMCLFLEMPVLPSQSDEDDNEVAIASAPMYIHLQSAYNSNWYLGFGPQRRPHGGHRGRALTPEGIEVLLPRRMSVKNPHPVRTDKCDFMFSTGQFTPDNSIHSEWAGLGQWLEQRPELKSNRALPLRRSSDEEAVSSGEAVGNNIDNTDGEGFDRNVSPSKHSRTKGQSPSHKISSSEYVPPLPSPLSLRRRHKGSSRKFRRKSPPSYFYDHNRRRDETGNPKVSQDLDASSPLFSSLLK